jgi:hypothetical protein
MWPGIVRMHDQSPFISLSTPLHAESWNDLGEKISDIAGGREHLFSWHRIAWDQQLGIHGDSRLMSWISITHLVTVPWYFCKDCYNQNSWKCECWARFRFNHQPPTRRSKLSGFDRFNTPGDRILLLVLKFKRVHMY